MISGINVECSNCIFVGCMENYRVHSITSTSHISNIMPFDRRTDKRVCRREALSQDFSHVSYLACLPNYLHPTTLLFSYRNILVPTLPFTPLHSGNTLRSVSNSETKPNEPDFLVRHAKTEILHVCNTHPDLSVVIACCEASAVP